VPDVNFVTEIEYKLFKMTSVGRVLGFYGFHHQTKLDDRSPGNGELGGVEKQR
jgi:hypothetical protein